MESEIVFTKAADCAKKAPILEKDGSFEVKTPSKVIDGRGNGVLGVDIVSWSSPGEVIDVDSSPQTPREDVFDPFAPGVEEKMCLAPQVKKVGKDVKISVTRRLDFGVMEEEEEKERTDLDLGTDDSCLQEEELLEIIYESFLDAIVTKQTESVVSEENGVCEEEGFKTPTRVPFLSGIAESCPAAPKKPRADSGKFVLGLCRKLEF